MPQRTQKPDTAKPSPSYPPLRTPATSRTFLTGFLTLGHSPQRLYVRPARPGGVGVGVGVGVDIRLTDPATALIALFPAASKKSSIRSRPPTTRTAISSWTGRTGELLGGVGDVAIQFAARAEARVITPESAHNAQCVRKLGADEVTDYRAEDVPARVREPTGGWGVVALVDRVGPTA